MALLTLRADVVKWLVAKTTTEFWRGRFTAKWWCPDASAALQKTEQKQNTHAIWSYEDDINLFYAINANLEAFMESERLTKDALVKLCKLGCGRERSH